ncbi:hypothetical protein NST17_20630 [Caldifermentibacillus hisashii]|uniref:Flagellin Flp1-like domain-containing protein n=1 Tax=Caldifermentibacillus hisashii TaxID=996558 RepID=A0ABU9K341_9BACI
MGEKTGSLTLMVTVLVVAVALILIVQKTFPDLASNIMAKMNSIVNNVTKVEVGNIGG